MNNQTSAKKLFENAKGIIFDFDGTIIDTESAGLASWRQTYRDFGVELPFDRYITCVGSGFGSFHPAKHLLETSKCTLSVDEIIELKNKYKSKMCENLQVSNGMMNLIQNLHQNNKKIIIASSSTVGWVSSHVKRLNLSEYFSKIIGKDLVSKVKPDPELFQVAKKSLGLSSSECLVLEDSKNGILASIAANIPVIALPNPVTQHSDLSMATLMIKDHEELTSIKL